MCEDNSRCTNCGEGNEMGVKCAFWVNLWSLVFFWIFEINLNFVIFENNK